MKQLVGLFSLFITFPIFGQTFISGGDVSGTWSFANSPYLIGGDIYVAGGDTLFIEPGVEIIFQNNYTFDISGCLQAQGTENDSIRFTEADTAGFSTGTDPGWSFNINTDYANFFSKLIRLSYCVIEYSNSISAFEMAFSDLQFSNSVIRNCKSYGLSVFGYSLVTLSETEFTENKGGGMYIWVTGSSGEAHISGCLINKNIGNGLTTAYGGGPVYIDSCMFSENSASGLLIAPDMPFFISNSIIENNGNVSIEGGGMAVNGYCSMNNVTVRNNLALNGGGLSLQNSILNDVTILNCRIESNTASQSGGGIFGYYPDQWNIGFSILSNNLAENGGGFYLYHGSYNKTFNNVLLFGNYASKRGGGVYIDENYDPVSFTRSTLADNYAEIEGSGIYSMLTDIDFNTGIVWNCNPSNIMSSGGNLTITYSDIEHGCEGTGNISSTPLFRYPAGKDYHLKWINYPLNDYTKSPCINAGDPSILADPDSTVADMGAYFYDQDAQIERSLDLKVFLEGPFLVDEMTNSLFDAGLIPDQQPFFAAPWYHYSTIAMENVQTNEIVDWIFIEIKKICDNTDPQKYYVVSRQPAFLLSDGSIRQINGSSLPVFYTNENDSLYVAIYHRNHLPVLSANPLNMDVNPLLYDFTSGEQTATGGFHSQKELVPGVWGMIAGDGNADFQINSLDKNEIWLKQLGNTGYLKGDFDMNGTIDNADKNYLWADNCAKGNVVSIKEEAPFECGDLMFDERDGQQYTTVKIGTQCWMAVNLNTGVHIIGSVTQGNNDILEKYCYEDLEINCTLYGGLYMWDEMMAYVTDTLNTGICPPNGGWRLPTDFDWKVLEGTVDSQFGIGDPEWNGLYKRGYDAGKNLKSTDGWYSNGNGVDLFGFNALPSGEWDYDSGFKFQHEYAPYFTTTPESDGKAWGRVLGANFDESFRGGYYKTYGFPVRCLKD
jgi:uncharacterized protein (TIGR02145 family)